MPHYMRLRLRAPREDVRGPFCQNIATVARVFSGVVLAVAATAVQAELFVSVQDGKQMLVAGKTRIVEGNDTLSVLELKNGRLRIVAEIPVPASVIGPPTSLAIVPGGALVLVTAGFKRDPADAGKVVTDDTLPVVDLKSMPPRVIDTLRVGKGAAGVSVNPAGTLALVANHEEGTVSVLSISGATVAVVDKVDLGNEKSGPMHVAITPDGKRALVSRDGDNKVTMLAIDGANKVTLANRDLFPGQRPDCIDIRAQGDLAVVANIGRGQGDADTVSLIDLMVEPPRVIDTVSVGQTPESAFFAPGGGYVAVNVMDGSNKPATSPFYKKGGQFVLLRLQGRRLVKVASTPIGVWPQGMAFSADGSHALVQNTGDQNIQLVRIRGAKLADTGQRVAFKGALASVQGGR
jgi:DNA-binding beta-propeller fold protein YncE